MISSFPEHVLYQTGLQRQINVGYIGLQQGTKSASRPADKPFINPLSAARRPRVYSSIGLYIIFFVRASKEILIIHCLSNAVRFPTALHGIARIHTSEGSFRIFVFDVLKDTRNGCLLGEPFCWRPARTGSGPQPRRARIRP